MLQKNQTKERVPLTPSTASATAEPAAPKGAKRAASANGRAARRAARQAKPRQVPAGTIAGDAVLPGVPEELASSPTQALVDQEIRRAMREARSGSGGDHQVGAPGSNSANGTVSTGTSVAQAAVAAAPARDEDAALASNDATDRPRSAPETAEPRLAPPPPTARSGQGGAPSVTALNEHLRLMTQQLTAAHRVIGRVAAERDALRRQVAELQGIPVEEVVISTLSLSNEAEKPAQPLPAEEPPPPSRWERLNYFGGDDIALVRKRRQTFVLILMVIGGIIALFARQMGWSMPENISRDSLAALPIIGNLMYVLLAFWMLFRVAKVGGKGIRWVFPTEDRRRRRR